MQSSSQGTEANWNTLFSEFRMKLLLLQVVYAILEIAIINL